MSREQWGHGYWKGVTDAQSGKYKANISLEAKYWIANMCISNYDKSFDRSLYPVREWVWRCRFSGLSQNYAKRIYDYILNHNYFDFRPEGMALCYVTGSEKKTWDGDYFVLPLWNYTKEEWQEIADKLLERIKNENRN